MSDPLSPDNSISQKRQDEDKRSRQVNESQADYKQRRRIETSAYKHGKTGEQAYDEYKQKKQAKKVLAIEISENKPVNAEDAKREERLRSQAYLRGLSPAESVAQDRARRGTETAREYYDNSGQKHVSHKGGKYASKYSEAERDQQKEATFESFRQLKTQAGDKGFDLKGHVTIKQKIEEGTLSTQAKGNYTPSKDSLRKQEAETKAANDKAYQDALKDVTSKEGFYGYTSQENKDGSRTIKYETKIAGGSLPSDKVAELLGVCDTPQTEAQFLREQKTRGLEWTGGKSLNSDGTYNYEFYNVHDRLEEKKGIHSELQGQDDFMRELGYGGKIVSFNEKGERTTNYSPLAGRPQYEVVDRSGNVVTDLSKLPDTFTVRLTEASRKATKEQNLKQSGAHAGFTGYFENVGTGIKYVLWDLPFAAVAGAGGKKEHLDNALAGPEFRPEAEGDLINVPIDAGIKAYQKEGRFEKNLTEGGQKYAKEVSDPKFQEFYAGSIAGSVAFGVATLGVGPLVKTLIKGGTKVPTTVKAITKGADALGSFADPIKSISSPVKSTKKINISPELDERIIIKSNVEKPFSEGSIVRPSLESDVIVTRPKKGDTGSGYGSSKPYDYGTGGTGKSKRVKDSDQEYTKKDGAGTYEYDSSSGTLLLEQPATLKVEAALEPIAKNKKRSKTAEEIYRELDLDNAGLERLQVDENTLGLGNSDLIVKARQRRRKNQPIQQVSRDIMRDVTKETGHRRGRILEVLRKHGKGVRDPKLRQVLLLERQQTLQTLQNIDKKPKLKQQQVTGFSLGFRGETGYGRVQEYKQLQKTEQSVKTDQRQATKQRTKQANLFKLDSKVKQDQLFSTKLLTKNDTMFSDRMFSTTGRPGGGGTITIPKVPPPTKVRLPPLPPIFGGGGRAFSERTKKRGKDDVRSLSVANVFIGGLSLVGSDDKGSGMNKAASKLLDGGGKNFFSIPKVKGRKKKRGKGMFAGLI